MFIRSLVLSLEHLMNEEVVFMGKTTVSLTLGIKMPLTKYMSY